MSSRYNSKKPGDSDGSRRPQQPAANPTIPHAKSYKKIHNPELPIIDLTSGPNISNIRDALTHYCERELGSISRIFEESKYSEVAMPTVDPRTLDKENDPHKINRDRHLAKLKQWDSDIQKYEESKPKLFGLIWSMTTKELDERVNEHLNASLTIRQISGTTPTLTSPVASESPNSTTSTNTANQAITSTNCPLVFWKAIVHVTTTRTNGNIKIDQDNVSIAFATIKQKPTESVADYKKRFSNIIESYGVVQVPVPAQWVQAIRFMQGLDTHRFGAMNRYFANELTNGKDNYPTTLDSAVSKATRWLIEPSNSITYAPPTLTTFVAERQKPKSRSAKSDIGSPADTCAFCNKPGHSQEMCHHYKARQKEAQDNSKSSRQKPRPKGKTAHFADQSTEDADDDTPSAMLGYHTISVSRTTLQALRSELGPPLPDTDIILDTGANGSIVNNAQLLSNLTSGEKMTFNGLSGKLSTSKQGTLADLCSASYHPSAPANIVSFSQLRALGHGIKLTTIGSNDAFIVTTPTKAYTFNLCDRGLYVYSQPASVSLIATVSDNEAKFNKREVARAKEARAFQQILANPPDQKLAQALSHGNIVAPDISTADILRATEIYGLNPHALQGRTTTQRPAAFPEVTPSRVMEPQQMYVDIFTAHGLNFLITITKPLEHILTSYIDSKDTGALRKTLRHHMGFYGQRRITVTHLYSDNERGISSLQSDFGAMGVQLITCGPSMHVHIVERSIRYLKEAARGVLSGLPYSCPRILFRHLPAFVAQRLNLFPVSTRSDHTSAFQLVYGRAARADRDCHLQFGAYYHITVRKPDNTMQARTTAAIGISQNPNGTGTCHFWLLHNHTIVQANHFKALPFPSEVLLYLNSLSAADKTKVSLSSPYYSRGSPIPEEDPPSLVTSDTGEESPPSTLEEPPEQPIVVEPPEGVTDHEWRPSDPDAANSDPHVNITPPVEISETEEEAQQPILTQPPDTDEPSDTSTQVTEYPVATPPEPHIYPTRIRRPPEKLNLMSIFHITAKRALREDPATARPAIEAELRTLLDMGVFTPVHRNKLTPFQRKNIIRSQLNVTQKFLPSSDGSGRVKDKVKARLVGGGDGQDRNLYQTSDTSSPTIATTSIFLIAQIAAAERRDVATIDIGSAYLNAHMPTADPAKLVHMKISPEVASIMCDIDKSFNSYRESDGTLIVVLKRALYGCLESALLWFKELSSFLTTIGFVPNSNDICVMNRSLKGSNATIGIYVDDIIITCQDREEVTNIISEIESKYKKLKVTRGTTHNYLGMILDFSTASIVSVCQTGMIEEIVSCQGTLTLHSITGIGEKQPKTPATEQLFSVNEESPPLTADATTVIHSLTAKILFIANRSRPDMLTFISFMTRRVLHPTMEDAKKLIRAINYLRSTADQALRLGYTDSPVLRTFIDASFATHPDRKSHTGVAVTLGTGVFYTKSTTQKINTTSSCESELVALSKGLQQSLWTRSFLQNQGFKLPPITVYQDNQSTIKLVERGRPGSEQTRHIDIGHFWIRDLIKRNLITITYCPTLSMIADFFTKPLLGTLYITMHQQIMGYTPIPTV